MPYINASEVGGPKRISRDHLDNGRTLTSRDIDIHGHDAVAASNNRVTVVVVATAVGTAAHANNPARVRHLIIDLPESRSHLVGQCAGHNHHIRLSWRCSENDTQAILVISGGREMHHLDGAACETESHGPQRALAGPICDLVKSGPSISQSKFQDKCPRETNKTYCMAPSFFS